MIFLSLGGGVQSSVMLMLAIHGEIERPDHVIFADTGWEPAGVYDHLDWCRKQCKKAGIPFHMVSAGNIRDDMVAAKTLDGNRADGGRWASMPLFTAGKLRTGMIRRQCTSEYKLAPLRKKQRELLGYKPRQRIPPNSCEVMIGISTDEARRASISRDAWVENIFPLIDPLKFSRANCQHWWENTFPHRKLVKSACIGCPYRSDKSWADMEKNDQDSFADAVLFDAQIRMSNGQDAKAYVHKSCVPLSNVDLQQSQASLDLDDEMYCAGGCGL